MSRGTIWLSNVECTSSDIVLAKCDHSGFGNQHSCSHLDDVAIVCEDRKLHTHS